MSISPYVYPGIFMIDKISPEEVILAAATICNVTPEKIKGKSRKGNIVKARQIAIYILCKKGLGWSEIGRLLNMHHTSVMYAYEKVDAEDIYQSDLKKQLKKVIDTLKI